MSEDDDGEPLSDLADRVPEPDEKPSEDPFEKTEPRPTAEDDAASDDRPSRADGDDPDDVDGRTDPDAPLGDLAARVDDRRRERARTEEDELFTERDVGEIDRDSLWEQVTAEEPTETVEGTVEDVREISKRSYCQGCEYFSAPPNVHCSHDGTEIREVVDLEHFRVVNCPIVREDERLGKMGDGTDE